MSLVTLEQVKAALRIDYDDQDVDLTLKIAQAEDIILDFIQPPPDPAWDDSTVPGRVSAAIIMGVGCLLDDTEEKMAMLSGLSGTDVDPKNPIAALLWRLRDPTLA